MYLPLFQTMSSRYCRSWSKQIDRISLLSRWYRLRTTSGRRRIRYNCDFSKVCWPELNNFCRIPLPPFNDFTSVKTPQRSVKFGHKLTYNWELRHYPIRIWRNLTKSQNVSHRTRAIMDAHHILSQPRRWRKTCFSFCFNSWCQPAWRRRGVQQLFLSQ